MNRNTLTAFLIILGTVIFFTSPTYNKFYVEKILKKEYVKPEVVKNEKEIEEKEKNEKIEIIETIKEEIVSEKKEEKK